jgi:hypothetical protein
VPIQDRPHARGREPDAYRGQLPVDPPIASGRILIRQAEDQRNRASRMGRSSRRPVSKSPLPPYQIPVPPQQRLRLDKESSLSRNRQKPAQSSEYRSIRWLQRRTRHLATQDCNLVAEHDDLDGQFLWLATYKTAQLEQTDKGDVQEGERHAPSSSA